MVPGTRATRERVLSITAFCLCVLVVGVAATALESSLTTRFTPDPPRSASSSGVSLLALLYAFLNAVLGLFGISLEVGGGVATGVSVLSMAVSTLALLYRYRLPVVAGIAVLAVVSLAIQHRDQLRRATDPPTEPNASQGSQRPQPESIDDWQESPPANAVARAWVELTANVDFDDPQVRTPDEWRTAAVEAGFDPAAVDTITETFREVRYGSATVTPARRRRVREARSKLRGNHEVSEE
jgi:hypothetical protein